MTGLESTTFCLTTIRALNQRNTNVMFVARKKREREIRFSVYI